MRFPKYGNYSLDISGNVLEVFATGAWNLKTTEFFIEEMHDLIGSFNGEPWAALMDGRRWVLSTIECQTRFRLKLELFVCFCGAPGGPTS